MGNWDIDKIKNHQFGLLENIVNSNKHHCFLSHRISETLKFKEELFRIGWYMRGSVSVNDLLERYSLEDIKIIQDIIKENIKVTKDTGMPLI